MLLLFFLVFFASAARIVQLGPGFWNVRAHLVLNGFDVGTQMSFIQLSNGNFVVVDTVGLDDELMGEINVLTKNGTLMQAVIATHPFHTLYFPGFYAAYPKPPYYGTPRHLEIQPQIPWAGSTYDCSTRAMWSPQIRMRIARGSEFAHPWPESNHFSGIHVFHPRSKIIHVDDTVIYDLPIPGTFNTIFFQISEIFFLILQATWTSTPPSPPSASSTSPLPLLLSETLSPNTSTNGTLTALLLHMMESN